MVNCENEEGCLTITIRDNGPGLSTEQRERVFEPFFTTKPKGTGLGMAIVKRIIEAHGGDIRVGGSTDGAEFLINFPPGSV
jgi:signal transduction histidine kinase